MPILNKIVADLEESTYEILIGRDIVNEVIDKIKSKTGNKNIVIVADSYFQNSIVNKFTKQLDDSGFRVFQQLMDAGKINKTIHESLKIYSLMEENNISRDSTLIAIGGGVIGDMCGFIASTWLRGMNLVHIPTTLMAMVDSSVGGKTAINFRNTINGIGSYYHPIVNGIDLDLIDTLLDRDYKSGIAEVIKSGIIADRKLFDFMKDNSSKILERNEDLVVHMISRALEIKLDHVSGDVRESGKRLLLNFGHTLGHSVEVSTATDGEEYYRHGEGVSIGISAAMHISEQFLKTDSNYSTEIKEIFDLYGLPTKVNSEEIGIEKDRLLERFEKNVMKDKKRLNDKLRLILAENIGKAKVYGNVPFDFVKAAFNHIII
jgi:3-dehydroquinate synthase